MTSQSVGVYMIRPVSNTITRPADTTAYGSGDLVANNTTAGSVTPFTFTLPITQLRGMIRRVGIFKSTNTTSNASFRVHFYSAAPTVANGDNGALAPTVAALTNYIGAADVTVDRTINTGAVGFGVPVVGVELGYSVATTTLWALLEARAAYGPGNAETFTIIPDIVSV